jgi:transitional endoplasmic reticulum ATPase
VETPLALTDESLLYLYGFVSLPAQLPAVTGVEENVPVFLVEYADVGCVVSLVPASAYQREDRSPQERVDWVTPRAWRHHDVVQRLHEIVEWPVRHRDLLRSAGVRPPRGVLLHGPPGSGKTLLVKAIARESRANFISVKGPELLSKYVGESEKGVREIFRKARQASPCVVFFDEIDAIAPRRGSSGDGHVTERVVAQMLSEMDGIEQLTGVLVLAATNRVDMLDPALLRPGRFDHIIEIGLPDEPTRLGILRVHSRGRSMADDVDLEDVAGRTQGFSGARLEKLLHDAAMAAVRDQITESAPANSSTPFAIRAVHIARAFDEAAGSNIAEARARQVRRAQE